MPPSPLKERQFSEEMGVVFSLIGGPPMTGRMLGHLLICDPPEQTAAELAEHLTASRGAISTTSRQLLAAGLIEKVPRPGSRAVAYRLRDDAWVRIMQSRDVHTRMMREQAEKGLELLRDEPPERRARLEEFVEFYRYFESAFPRLVQEYLAARETR